MRPVWRGCTGPARLTAVWVSRCRARKRCVNLVGAPRLGRGCMRWRRGAPAALGLSVAPRALPLPAAGPGPSCIAAGSRGLKFEAGGASYRARGLRSGGRSCGGAARSADGRRSRRCCRIGRWRRSVAALQNDARPWPWSMPATLIAELGDPLRALPNPRPADGLSRAGCPPSIRAGASIRRGGHHPRPANAGRPPAVDRGGHGATVSRPGSRPRVCCCGRRASPS